MPSKMQVYPIRTNALLWILFKVCFNILFVCFLINPFIFSLGNEEDVIILSLVRTKELGFLQDLRRTNVMLTRCKKFMFVVSSWDFLINGHGANSLAGRMAACLGEDAWIWPEDIETGNW